MSDDRLRIALSLLVASLSIASYIERAQIRATWHATVGAWFARRRVVGVFLTRRYALIRLPRPSEHTRRDINTGVWT